MPSGAFPAGRHSRHLSSLSVTTPTSPSERFLTQEKREEEKSNVSSVRMAVLTCSILGVQIFWSILMSHGTPYLHTLGFSSALTSLVWMAGPLGGVLIQPIVGAWSDNYVPKAGSTFEDLGRRKPFILFGALGVAVCMLGLATVREGFEFLGMLIGMPKAKLESAIGEEGHGSPLLVIVAFVWVYCLNIGIHPLQAGVRAYVLDSVPPHQQGDAAAWLSRWNCIGAVFAFWLGSIDLPRIVPFFGRTQFRTLTIIEVVVLLLTIPTSFAADTGLAARPANGETSRTSVKEIWMSLYRTYKSIPRRSWTVFQIQFWAWMAWFPFLYYNTVYIGSLTGGDYVPDASVISHTQGGLAESGSNHTHSPRNHYPPSLGTDPGALAAQTGSFASFLFALMSLVFTFVLPFLTHNFRFLTVERLWFVSHVAFAAIMAATYFVNSVAAGTALMAFLGFSWAMTQWAPFALISSEVSSVEAEAREDRESGWGEGPGREMAGAGAVFGLHNVAIAGPQVIAAMECAGLFKLLGAIGVADEIGSVLRWAGLAALGAAWVCRRLLQ